MEYNISSKDIRNVILERSEADAGFNLFVYVYYNLNSNELLVSCYDNMADDRSDLIFLGDVTEWERPSAAIFCLEEADIPENIVDDWRKFIEARITDCRVNSLSDEIFIKFFPTFKKLAES